MLSITPIPALETNYIWTITSAIAPGKAVVVDPGTAQPVLQYLKHQQLSLAAILITHHHADHTGGLDEILQHIKCPVYAGAIEPIAQASHRLTDGEKFTIEALNLRLMAIHVPGHTKGHTAFYGHANVFTGDTLFAAGCGRNFEGSYQQLYQSLLKLAALPVETQIYCGHEYSEQNLRFGATVEPDNAALLSKLKLVAMMRADGQCTLPSSFAEELTTNVFLRCHLLQVKTAAENHAQCSLTTPDSVFAVLRQWKNHF